MLMRSSIRNSSIKETFGFNQGALYIIEKGKSTLCYQYQTKLVAWIEAFHTSLYLKIELFLSAAFVWGSIIPFCKDWSY